MLSDVLCSLFAVLNSCEHACIKIVFKLSLTLLSFEKDPKKGGRAKRREVNLSQRRKGNLCISEEEKGKNSLTEAT